MNTMPGAVRRYINRIFTVEIGEQWDNARLLKTYEPIVERLALEEAARTKLRDFVRFQLVGERSRNVVRDWDALNSFASRAAAFESAADQALDALAAQIAPAATAAGITFDAIVSTTATGNLTPGLSYRMAHRLKGAIRTDSLMLDLGGVGCTGAIKALNVIRRLDETLRHVLLVAVEVPSTLVGKHPSLSAWQGNCTFGDGAAALWVATDSGAGEPALAIEDLRFWQHADTGLDLIRCGYDDYYRFDLRNEKTFDQDVRQYVVSALEETRESWKNQPRWAIHPAGVVLLVRISRKLGIPAEAIQPSIAHYRAHSNMSSVSILHILRDVAAQAPAGAGINLLTMGAGFNVMYGLVRRM
jgi:alkylresorcinol/alkylpyrone synthase